MRIAFRVIDWSREWRTPEQIAALARAKSAAQQRLNDEQVEQQWHENIDRNNADRLAQRILEG